MSYLLATTINDLLKDLGWKSPSHSAALTIREAVAIEEQLRSIGLLESDARANEMEELTKRRDVLLGDFVRLAEHEAEGGESVAFMAVQFAEITCFPLPTEMEEVSVEFLARTVDQEAKRQKLDNRRARHLKAQKQLDDYRRRTIAPRGSAEDSSNQGEPLWRHIEGNEWDIRFAGKRECRRYRSATGMRYIAGLLQWSRDGVAAVKLRALAADDETSPSPGIMSQMKDEMLEGEGLRSGLDAGDDPDVRKTLDNYRRALKENQSERERAGDQATRDRLDKDTAWIEREIKRLGNRRRAPRRELDETDKARKSVSLAIERAITEIDKWNSDLARHLKPSIFKGKEFVYDPRRAGEAVVEWRF